jgi:hypothetical protein
MARRFTSVPDHLREPHEIEIRGFWNVYFLAIGITILLGLLGGALWIGWRLLTTSFGG